MEMSNSLLSSIYIYVLFVKWQFRKTVVNFFLLVQNFANKNVCWDMPRSDDLYHNFTYKSSVVF